MRTHLLGIAAAVLVVGAVVGLALTAGAYSSARRRVVAAARDSARQTATAIERDLGQAGELNAASAPGVAPIFAQSAAVMAQPEVCSLTYSGVGVFPPEGAVHILLPDGRVLCSSSRAALGRSYAAAPWFARLAGGEAVTVGDGRDAVTGGPVAVTGAPVQGPSGAVIGALVQTAAVGPLAPALAGTFGGPIRRQFVVVDGGGQVLSSSIEGADQGQRFPGIADGATARDSRGRKQIWGVGTVAPLGWRVWSATGEARALGPARGERRRLALVLAVALAAAVALALLVNRRLVRPVRGLSGTVVRAETEPDARAAEDGPAELVDLARRLNHMLATRQRNEQVVADLAAELETTAVSLVEAREQERQSLAIALHDTTLQGLIAATWQVDALSERSGPGAPDLTRLRRDLETLVDQTRAVTSELRPPALRETGLGAAVDELARRAGRDSGFTVEVEDRLAGARFTTALEMLVYRTIQEALHNVRRHARATTVRIVLERDDRLLRATVTDDGVGVDDAALAERAREGHLGVVSMRDTVRLAKGRFSITRGEPAGTVVSVEIPAPAGAPLHPPE